MINCFSIDLEQVENGYHVNAVVRVRSEEFQCSFSFDEEYSLTDYNCECTWCTDDSPCAHIGAVLLKLNQLEISSFPYHYINTEFEEEKKASGKTSSTTTSTCFGYTCFGNE